MYNILKLKIKSIIITSKIISILFLKIKLNWLVFIKSQFWWIFFHIRWLNSNHFILVKFNRLIKLFFSSIIEYVVHTSLRGIILDSWMRWSYLLWKKSICMLNKIFRRIRTINWLYLIDLERCSIQVAHWVCCINLCSSIICKQCIQCSYLM